MKGPVPYYVPDQPFQIHQTSFVESTMIETHFPFQSAFRFPQRRGLSLLELLVVLTILIALGGIVVATLPGMLKRTQVAMASANVPEIDATIKRNATLTQGRIGNRFDSLISGADSLDGSVPSYVGGAEVFEATTLASAEVAALREIGVTELVPAIPETENATFQSHDQLPVEIGNDTKVCTLNSEIAANLLKEEWNLDPIAGAKYVVFGLGEQCSMVGAGPKAAFSETPIHFSDDRSQSPEEMYSRYLLIVEIRPSSESFSIARYVGTAIPDKNGIHSISRELENYYTEQN
jgi:Tfp pilus assembly protein PilE